MYLETCCLGWVDGLYRRFIHEPLGSCGETRRAGGDTAFKTRVMPHIRSVHVAESGDLRAWYLWRRRTGMALHTRARCVQMNAYCSSRAVHRLRHQAALTLAHSPCCAIFNDKRYEQHGVELARLSAAKPRAFRPGRPLV